MFKRRRWVVEEEMGEGEKKRVFRRRRWVVEEEEMEEMGS